MRKKQPDNAAIAMVQGRLLLQTGRTDQAEAVFKDAVELNPDLIGPYVSLAKIYISTDKAEEAISQYRILLEKNPNLVSAYMAIGTIEEQSGHYDKAEKAYMQALEIKQDFAPAANNLAWLLAEKKHDLDQAFIYAQKAKAAAPEQPAILDTVGWILTKRGSYELAVSNFEEAIQKWPNQPTLHYHMAVALKGMKKIDAAKEELKKAINTKEKFPEIEDARRLLEELP